ncbi:MAG: cytochrome ubiquinol oxidase subunit I [Desulfovibrio sp.]
MDFPIWNLTTYGGGFWIALIATLHVYVAHFAVGGGLFIVLAERRARLDDSPLELEYVKKHSRFFLLLSMVFGGVSGVGLWFTSSLLSPGGTAMLIREFSFLWAAEWMCFLTEIVALLVYYYTFDKMEPKRHVIVGWIYFISAWLSLFIINGIIDFMLTPGEWLKSRSIIDAFFNPTFYPSLAFRSSAAFMIAGLFGFFTATRIKDAETRVRMVRHCALWAGIPLILTLISGWWYLQMAPEPVQTYIENMQSQMSGLTKAFVYSVPILGLGALLMALKLPRGAKTSLALVMLITGFVFFGSFESIRERARKPYIIYKQLYVTGIEPGQIDEINEKGILTMAKWAKVKDTSDPLKAGAEIFQIECVACHSIDGPMRDILPRTEKFTLFGMDSFLNGMGKVNYYMPPFAGTADERMALAQYIVEELHGKTDTGQKPVEVEAVDVEIPAKVNDEYVLLAWNNLGMHCISDSSGYWVFLPPANDLQAQLIKRGDSPEVVTEGVVLSYKVEEGFENPASKVEFWKNAEAIFGKKLPENVGLSGNGMTGELKYHENAGLFEASLIPVVPYPEGGKYQPYPRFTIEARDSESGELLAQTVCVAPTSTEIGCNNCHGGEWKVDGMAGISDKTAEDVLVVHDRMNGTNLKELADAGQPQLCQSCHADPVLGATGKEGILNLPAAIHGFHANVLTDRAEEACAACHPNRDEGPTNCLRGRHDMMGITCVDCHGTMEDHALSLLKKEEEAGKPSAPKLMKNLKPRSVETLAEINPRTPWMQEPDCLNCHTDEFTAPETMSAFNQWTADGADLYRNRKGEMMAVHCAACHGSPHAIYPADNIYGENLDNIPPMQYMGEAATIGSDNRCTVCHTVEKEYSAHHPNMLPEE